MKEPKMNLETIIEKLKKLNNTVIDIERRLKILKMIEKEKDWNVIKFKKFLTIYLEEYKDEWIKEFVENDIDVAKGMISSVIEILKHYSKQELILWALPVLETCIKEIEIYEEILSSSFEQSPVIEKIKNYAIFLKNKVQDLITQIKSLSEKDE